MSWKGRLGLSNQRLLSQRDISDRRLAYCFVGRDNGGLKSNVHNNEVIRPYATQAHRLTAKPA